MRGINVGGRNLLPMPELARIFERAGCSRVRTYIQSGNVVFAASAACIKSVPSAIAAAVGERYGFEPSVVLRSAHELKRVVAANPFKGEALDPRLLHVGFLADKPPAANVARLDPSRAPSDRFVVRSKEIYVNYALGAGKSKLTGAYIDRVLGTSSTFRNWNTVLKLLEMC